MGVLFCLDILFRPSSACPDGEFVLSPPKNSVNLVTKVSLLFSELLMFPKANFPGIMSSRREVDWRMHHLRSILLKHHKRVLLQGCDKFWTPAEVPHFVVASGLWS